MRILIVSYLPKSFDDTRPNVFHHLRALESDESAHELYYYNVFEEAPYWMDADSPPDKDLGKEVRKERFDAVVLHYTFLSVRTVGHQFYCWKYRFNWLGDYEVPVVAIPQDEGNYAEILDEWLKELNVSVIFSVHFRENGPLYPLMRHRAMILPCLPGYIDAGSAKKQAALARPMNERANDIVYRAMRLPLRFGCAGRMKSLVADKVLDTGRRLRLQMDVSADPDNPIPGNQWFDFLRSGRCAIGCEGGYSAIDWRGELTQQIDNIMDADAPLTLEELNKKLPSGWDQYRLLTITPRHLEAAMTRTAQLLIEGEYKGILIPGRHYLPIKRDFSNLEEVLSATRDYQKLQDMADNVYADICMNKKYHYSTFARQIGEAIRMAESKKSKTDSPQREEATEKSLSRIVSSLETQLIAERHRNMLLEGKLSELLKKVALPGDDVKRTLEPIFTKGKRAMLSASLIMLFFMISVTILLGFILWKL